MQGIGILAAAAVSIFTTLIMQAANPGGPYDKHSVHGIKASVSDLADYVWRIQVSRVSALSRQLTVFSPSLAAGIRRNSGDPHAARARDDA